MDVATPYRVPPPRRSWLPVLLILTAGPVVAMIEIRVYAKKAITSAALQDLLRAQHQRLP